MPRLRLARRDGSADLRALAGLFSRLAEVAPRATHEEAGDGWTGLPVTREEVRHTEKAASYGRWRIHADVDRVDWSPGIAEIFGRPFPPSGFLSLDAHLACYHPDDAPSKKRRIRDALAGRRLQADGSYRARGRILRPDGEVRHVIIQGVAERGPDGRVSGLQGIILDVTELTRSERRTEDAGALMRLTLETMDHGLVMIGPDGRVRVHNARALDLIGVGPDLLREGVPFDQVRRCLIARGEYEGTDRQVREWAERGDLERVPTIYRRRRPDGRHLEIRAVPLPDGGVVRTYVDVSARRAAEMAAVEGERRFRLLAETTTDVIIWSGLDTVRRYVSPASLAVFGHPPEDLVGTRPLDHVHPDDRAAYSAVLDDLCSGRLDQAVTCQRYRHVDGRWIDVEASFKLTRDGATDAPDGYVASLRDATGRKKVEDALRLSEERLALALDGGSDGLWDWDIGKDSLVFSGRWLAMLDDGGAERERSGEDWQALVHPEDRARIRAALADHLSGRTPVFEVEYRARAADGDLRWTLARGKVVAREGGRATRMVGTHVDITKRKEAEGLVAHMATHDALTGLPNRTLFRERLKGRIAEAARGGAAFAVLACDLDRFKSVNDALGHAAGDRLLRVVADRLAATLHGEDTVARLGGDEFAILLADGTRAGVENAAARLIEAISRPVEIEGHRVTVGMSVGVALAPLDGGGADDLHRCADLAMYRAKGDGRNAVRFFSAGMDAAVADRALLAQDLRRACEDGELTLNYQPIVDLVGRRIVGFEALMRWDHPERGAVPPSEFIPVAEATGLIDGMGDWALGEACRRAATWPRDLRVAVDVSAIQFREPDRLKRNVIRALMRSGLLPDRLELEITESVLMDDAETVIACLQDLRRLGVRIALDDFGNGFSSLGYLRRFPFDRIKIDRSFVQDMDQPATRAIVRSVVDLAARLGAGVVAEGVETRKQLASVRREGCSEVQGYLCGRPVTGEEAAVLIARWRGRRPSRGGIARAPCP